MIINKVVYISCDLNTLPLERKVLIGLQVVEQLIGTVQLLHIQFGFVSFLEVDTLEAVIGASALVLSLPHLLGHLIELELESLPEIVFKFLFAVTATT